MFRWYGIILLGRNDRCIIRLVFLTNVLLGSPFGLYITQICSRRDFEIRESDVYKSDGCNSKNERWYSLWNNLRALENSDALLWLRQFLCKWSMRQFNKRNSVLSVPIVPGLGCETRWCIPLQGCALYQLIVPLPEKIPDLILFSSLVFLFKGG